MPDTQPLHIAISARSMSLPFGGVKEYVSAMTRELVRRESPHRFTIFYSDARLVGANPNASEVYLPAPHKFAWDHMILPRRLRHIRPDVVWFPHNVSSLGLGQPAVVSVMDMLYFRMPELPFREYAWPDTLYMRAFIPRSLRAARRVMVISDWTGRDIARLCGIPAEKIRTIHLAPDCDFKPLDAARGQAARKKYDLERPFFLYAGTLSPRKNVRALIEAFGRVSSELPHDLVVTGGPGYIETPFDDLLARYAIAGRVKRLNIIPKEDLVALYNLAEAFVFPSLYEGFGIPPLEAMACGCPVISSRATSLAEVVGEAALTFDPRDVATLAAHMRAIAGDDGLRARLARAGRAHAATFSYRRAAAELMALLEEAAR
jgi:glycosyltransferase involved in cell wall biosynthesis